MLRVLKLANRCELPMDGKLTVLLNVYDVTSTPGDANSTLVRLNNITRRVGGVFHGAVQIGTENQAVEAIEFSFGWCERGTGVYAVHARQNPMYQYRETVHLGTTPKSIDEAIAIIQELKVTWQGYTYDLLNRNCCHFCEELAQRLEVAPVPGWLNRFASGAAATVAATQETVKTVQDIGQELGRLSGESLTFLKSSWAKTLAAASQQQQQLAERLQQQQRLRLQWESPHQELPAAPATGSNISQQQQPHGRSVSAAELTSGSSSSSSVAAWSPALGPASSSNIAATVSAAGVSLMGGLQQAGRQIKATTSKLAGLRLQGSPMWHQEEQEQQQQEQGDLSAVLPAAQGPAAEASWAEAAAGGQEALTPAVVEDEQQQQQQVPPSQQRQQSLGGAAGAAGRLLPGTQPKLAREFCASSSLDGDSSDLLGSLLAGNEGGAGAAGGSGGGSGARTAAERQHLGSGGPGAAAAPPAGVDLLI